MSNLSDNAFHFTRDLEVSIRGKYIRFSASIEGLMTKCIVYLNEIQSMRTGKEENINFKNLTFYKKEEEFKRLLELVYKDLLLSNSDLFEQLSLFREMRNKMAHCYFTWDESDLAIVTIWDIEDKKSKLQRVVPTKYKIQDLLITLQSSMDAMIDDMNALSAEVIIRVKPEIPYMFE